MDHGAHQSSAKPRVRVLCLPDIDRAIGGVKQLYRHVEHLVALGWDAAVVTGREGFRPSWFVLVPPPSLAESVILVSSPEATILCSRKLIWGGPGSFRGLNLPSCLESYSIKMLITLVILLSAQLSKHFYDDNLSFRFLVFQRILMLSWLEILV